MHNHFQPLMRCSSSASAANPTIAVTDEPCSGRGDCLNGTCLCEIRYSGDECDNFNLPYHAGKCFWSIQFYSIFLLHKFTTFLITTLLSFSALGVSSVFYFVAALSIVQLLICCVAEYQRLKQPSLLRALRLTTQKLLYFVVFVAALLRGAYFTTPVSEHSSIITFCLVHSWWIRATRQCTEYRCTACTVTLNDTANLLHFKKFLCFVCIIDSIGSTTTGLGFDFDIGILSIAVDMLITCRLLVGRGEC